MKDMEKYFSEWFNIISEHDAEQLWNDGDRSFLVLTTDGSDRYADCFDTWDSGDCCLYGYWKKESETM